MRFSSGLLFAVAVALASSRFVCAQGPGANTHPLEPTIASGGEIAATTGVEVWLATVDDGRYPDSWQSAGSIFKKVVDKDHWIEILKTNRQPLGKLLSRHVTSKQFVRSLPGAPEGQYVEFKYDASFEHRKAAVETITALLDSDGQWRVVGYFVR